MKTHCRCGGLWRVDECCWYCTNGHVECFNWRPSALQMRIDRVLRPKSLEALGTAANVDVARKEKKLR